MPGCREDLPTFISPMLASPGALARPGDSDAWVAECKWDGVRALVAIDALGRVSVRSRWGRDHTARFPELAGLRDQARRDDLTTGASPASRAVPTRR